jgi:hypothetical protein
MRDMKHINVISNVLAEMAHPTLKREDIQNNALALLKRLRMAGFEIVPVQSDKGISENARLHNEACDSERKISVVVVHCEHPVVAHDIDDGATCSKCGRDLGWFCHISPKHYCEYKDDEACIHCGAPEERQ